MPVCDRDLFSQSIPWHWRQQLGVFLRLSLYSPRTNNTKFVLKRVTASILRYEPFSIAVPAKIVPESNLVVGIHDGVIAVTIGFTDPLAVPALPRRLIVFSGDETGYRSSVEGNEISTGVLGQSSIHGHRCVFFDDYDASFPYKR